MSELFPAVAEGAATGRTSELFADIRATIGVKVVNLVWRHLATMDDALNWTWGAVKPLYLRGMVDVAALQFRETMVLPRLGSLAGEELASVDAVLASYDHSNTMNLFALGAMVAWLRGGAAGSEAPKEGARLLAPEVVLPMLASEGDVLPDVWQRVLRLNKFGDRDEPLILASMYRHLAHAPTFLERLEPWLASAQSDGSLVKAIAVNRAAAQEKAAVLATAISAQHPRDADAIESALSAFLDHAIGKMVTICRAVRVARGSV